MYYYPNNDYDDYKEYFDCKDKLMELAYGETYKPSKCIDRVEVTLDCNGVQQTKVIHKTFTEEEINNLLTELYNNSEYIELTYYKFDVILDGEKTLIIVLRTNDNTNRLIEENRGSLVSRINMLNADINYNGRIGHVLHHNDLYDLDLNKYNNGDLINCIDDDSVYVVRNNHLNLIGGIV